MRRLVVCNIMSLDGYYEGPGGNVMDLFEYRFKTYPDDESFDAYIAERLRSADVVLFGRRMFDQSKGYWPDLADDSGTSAVERGVSRLLNTVDKVVISDSLAPNDTKPWQDSTRIVKRADSYERIARLKNHDGRDILVFGSRTLWNDLLEHGLVDELHLVIAPVVLGAGTPVFGGRPSAELRLMGAHTWPGSGLVLARY